MTRIKTIHNYFFVSANYSVKTINHPINLELAVPGSKSITNRAFLIAMLANGTSTLKGCLESDDTHRMQEALIELGIKIEKNGNNFTIEGNNGNFKNKNDVELYLGNAGTAVRFLTAAMSLREGKTLLTGNERMQKRPIQNLINGLQQAGVEIKSLKQNGYPPLQIQGNTFLGGKIEMPGDVSSQYFSALLLTAPYAKKEIELNVTNKLCSKPYIDITLDIMNKFGVQYQNSNYQSFKILPNCYQAQEYTIEGDASAASYFIALVALHGGKIKITNLPYSSKQGDVHFVDVVSEMIEGDFKLKKDNDYLEFSVSPNAKLKGLGKVDMNKMPDVSMTLAMLAPFAEGETIITNVPNMRVKETDRIKAIVTELNKLGIEAKELNDGIKFTGRLDNGKLKLTTTKTEIETYDDHRMAMCFGILGTKINGIKILNPKCVNKTYPNFWKDLKKVYRVHHSEGNETIA